MNTEELKPRACIRCNATGRWGGADCNLCGGSGFVLWDAPEVGSKLEENRKENASHTYSEITEALLFIAEGGHPSKENADRFSRAHLAQLSEELHTLREDAAREARDNSAAETEDQRQLRKFKDWWSWLARTAWDDKLTPEEAIGIIQHHPTVKDMHKALLDKSSGPPFVTGDAALSIGEDAFRAGWEACYAKAVRESRADELAYDRQLAWDNYDPPEDIKALTRDWEHLGVVDHFLAEKLVWDQHGPSFWRNLTPAGREYYVRRFTAAVEWANIAREEAE